MELTDYIDADEGRMEAEPAEAAHECFNCAEAKESSLAGLLLQAIQLAGTRRGRLAQAESIREQTLLEVLTTKIRRAQ
jgi:hypothetical protein